MKVSIDWMRHCGAVLLLSTLAACSLATPPAPSATPFPTPLFVPSQLPARPSPTAQPTLIPATATAPAPTATPLVSSTLVGPEWTIAASGDINGDGSTDVIAYKPANITRSPLVSSASYADYNLIASELVIVQEGADGRPQLQLGVTTDAIYAADTLLLDYPAEDTLRTPAAFLLAVDAASPIPVRIIPLNSAGEPYTQGVGMAWNSADQGYRLVASGEQAPAAQLVGPEWTVVAQGDLNQDGRTEVVAYQPAALPAQPYNPPYPLIVAQAVIVEARLDGPPEILLAVTPEKIWASGTTLLLYSTEDPSKSPAAFALRVNPSDIIPLEIVPLNSAGEVANSGVGVAWNSAEAAYRLVAIEQ